nr:9336_t:CDS:2 [Entrophospora candida]
MKISDKVSSLNMNDNDRDNKNGKEVEIITVMLVGSAANGKSTLASVISGSKIFDESHNTIRSTKNTNTRNFLIDGKIYRIVDTIGLGNSRMELKEVLSKLLEAAETIKCGINQILFVTKGIFSGPEIEIFETLQSLIFDEDVFKYTTIIKTNFAEFEDDDECEKDYNDMISEDDKISQFIKSCKKVIHLDNPPITPRTKQVAEEIREESRKKILSYLCTCTEVYMPKNLQEFINAKVKDYMTEKSYKIPEIKTIKILLLGRKGSGKTTLANVINNTNNNTEKSTYRYEIIDPEGIGDRRLTPQGILYKFADAAAATGGIKDGINQILFVINGRFTEEEIETFETLQSIIFNDENIVNFTTIIKTKFPVFEEDDECEKDYNDMISVDDKISQLVKSCKKVIHVDNPPITPRTKQVAEEIREESRKKILSYLCTCTEVYMPKNLQEVYTLKNLQEFISAKVKDYMTEKSCNIL